MTKNPHKLADRLLTSKSSIGLPDDDLKMAFRVLMAVAEGRYGKANPRVIIRDLVSDHGRKAVADMVSEIDVAAVAVTDDFKAMTDGYFAVLDRVVETSNGTTIDALAAVMLYIIEQLDLPSDLDIEVEDRGELIPERKAILYFEDSIKRGRHRVARPPKSSGYHRKTAAN